MTCDRSRDAAAGRLRRYIELARAALEARRDRGPAGVANDKCSERTGLIARRHDCTGRHRSSGNGCDPAGPAAAMIRRCPRLERDERPPTSWLCGKLRSGGRARRRGAILRASSEQRRRACHSHRSRRPGRSGRRRRPRCGCSWSATGASRRSEARFGEATQDARRSSAGQSRGCATTWPAARSSGRLQPERRLAGAATWSAQGIPAPRQRRLRQVWTQSIGAVPRYGTRATLRPAFCSWATMPVGPA